MIVIKGTKRINSDLRWVMVTLDVDGEPCHYIDAAPYTLPVYDSEGVIIGSTPVDPKTWVESREDEYRHAVRLSQYGSPQLEVRFNEHKWEALDRWIAEHPEVQKKAWDQPLPEDTDETDLFKSAALDRINISQLRSMTFTQVDTYISNIANLADAKAALQKIAEVVLALVKYQLKEG